MVEHLEVLCDVITWSCLLAGGFFSVVGGIGIVRLPDFFTRLHGGGITDTLGAGLIMVGLMFQAGWSLALVKTAMILGFLLMTSPTACHALAQAALTQGHRPLLSETGEKVEFATPQHGAPKPGARETGE